MILAALFYLRGFVFAGATEPVSAQESSGMVCDRGVFLMDDNPFRPHPATTVFKCSVLTAVRAISEIVAGITRGRIILADAFIYASK